MTPPPICNDHKVIGRVCGQTGGGVTPPPICNDHKVIGRVCGQTGGGVNNRAFLRILDANFNRCREGLRVCEETARFILQNAQLTAHLKKARHEVTSILNASKSQFGELLSSRDSVKDVGKAYSRIEKDRSDFGDIFFANIQRAKEALRVLEEVSKLFNLKHSAHFKKIRFQVYDIEKQALLELEALRHHRPKRS